jgi:hypothetical protein
MSEYAHKVWRAARAQPVAEKYGKIIGDDRKGPA